MISICLEGNLRIAQVNQPLCPKLPASCDAMSEMLKRWKMSANEVTFFIIKTSKPG